MSTEARPLDVLTVSRDVSLLHEVAWALEAVGYKVQTSDDLDPNALWRRYSLADIFLVDVRGIAEPTAEVLRHDSDKSHYQIVLYDPAKPTDLAACYAAGAHDALRAPISRGELFARVRTGARYLEFERRLQHRAFGCEMAGMISRRGLLHRLRKMNPANEQGISQHTLLVISIDWYAGMRQKCGDIVSRNLVTRAGRAIRRSAGENVISAYLGDGQFATLLVGQTATAAKSIAQTLAEDFCTRESMHESTARSTLTIAIMPWNAGCKPEQLLKEGLDTLTLADHSGRNCILLHGQFGKELERWRNEITTGNPFENVVAQDIMEPFPALLDCDGEPSELAESLRRAGVPVRPYVDREGRLVGVAMDDHSEGAAGNGQVEGAMGEKFVQPETISASATFPEIYEVFSTRVCAALVVTADDRPLGYITCNGFLSMIDPVNAATFAHTDKSVDELAYLVVPATIEEASREAVSA